MRGLKPREWLGEQFILEAVAPLAGAWIETEPIEPIQTGEGVAPLAGAWIETRLMYPSAL